MGTGKTYFVLNKLVPELKEGEKLLYLCNRRKLNKDIKYDLLEYLGEALPKNNDELKELHKREVFGNVHVINYQRLEGFLIHKEFDVESFKYICMDEIHYLDSDSSFNHKTFISKQVLMDCKFENSIKIFISATMNNVLPFIKPHTYNNLYPYNTGRDFSYLKPSYFANINDIIQLIINDETDEKWLIFVTSVNKGDYIKDKLLENDIDAVFTHKGTKKDYIIDEQFEEKVYICTRHIDNGVNIKDDKLKHMVVMAYDETTFIQEIGRCRIDITNAREVNLYIPTFTKKNFTKRMESNYEPKLNMVKEFDKDEQAFQRKYRYDHSKVPNTLFVLDEDNNWKRNEDGIKKLLDDKKFAEKMVKNFDKGEKGDFFAYVKEQLKWLGLEGTFHIENFIKNVPSKFELDELYQYLKVVIGKKLFAKEQRGISDIILNRLITIQTGVDYRTTTLKPKTLESILRDQLNLPFAVSKPKQETKGEMRGKRYIVISEI